MSADITAMRQETGAIPFRLEHLHRLTDEIGLFEHSLHDEPRRGHGYTTDDNARALVVLSRAWTAGLLDEPNFDPYLEFTVNGLEAGSWHNRMDESGRWTDRIGSDDCHGRAIWGLGEVIAAHHLEDVVVDAFQAGLHGFRSAHPRAVAYAVLGVVASRRLLTEDPLVDSFLERVVSTLPPPSARKWAWVADRLTYDNARLPEAMIRAGADMGNRGLVEQGLFLLDWLVDQEIGANGFSFTPVGGRGRRDPKPGFDQQPIEAWAMVDACAAAFEQTGEERWRALAHTAIDWFLGANDGGRAVYDLETGAGHDGLQEWGLNLNRGAESTLAALGSIVRSRTLDEHEPLRHRSD